MCVVFQTKQVADMKTLLRDAAEREQALVNEKEELLRKVLTLICIGSSATLGN
jgi:hypothetical protein